MSIFSDKFFQCHTSDKNFQRRSCDGLCFNVELSDKFFLLTLCCEVVPPLGSGKEGLRLMMRVRIVSGRHVGVKLEPGL